MSNKKHKVYVDGQHGTTGLSVNQYLEKHPDIELITIDFDDRRELDVRKACLNEADIVILCLPDDASRESVSMITNTRTRVIDASTAYRTDPDWTYGMPELSPDQRGRIKKAMRVSNPGCHATAAVLALSPLVKEGILSANYPVSYTSVSGYSGAGKGAIEDYEVKKIDYLALPRPYALTMNHKHLVEMQKHIGLTKKPLFTPIINNYYKGLVVSVAFNMADLSSVSSLQDVYDFYQTYYGNEYFIKVHSQPSGDGIIAGGFDVLGSNDTNNAEIFILGNDSQVLIMCRIDNLGKGASGAAIQNLNIMIGSEEGTTLT
ncbi:MAG: N-acetyl-gamma-glutamyl-phosphate reductase [Vallitaleaceae bacterium]|jgi:N-acetyl-gamma-glutamyl-phosphate reductase|nr:N-acetyl-gamma-glutamyl-phosphate reductase [Vallitaleaceae bacterium]